jgi:hypothetical protein
MPSQRRENLYVRTRAPVIFARHQRASMHPALLLPEILGRVFGHLAPWGARDKRREGSAELAALSVVSRAFSEQALDFVWASVDPLPLASLMPSDLRVSTGSPDC